MQCVVDDHDVLTITMDSWPTSLYDAAKGRLFSLGSHISIERNREYQAWPGVLDDAGLLKGKTHRRHPHGYRRPAGDHRRRADPRPSRRSGYKVAAEAVLPCPEGSQTCEQQDVAIQRMQDAGVDTVFLVAQTLAGSATVEAAQTLGYKPQWMTIGNNVTNTVAKFYANAKDELRRRLRPRHPASATRPRRPPTATRSRSPAAPRSSRSARTATGSPAVTCIQMQSIAQRDRGGRRHRRPGVGHRGAGDAQTRC